MQPEPRHDPALPIAPQPGEVSRAVSWDGVGVLSVVQLFSFIDRQALSLLIAPIISTISTAGSTGVQELALPRMRGIAAAIYLFIFNGSGLSLGPTLFAVLTDEAFGDPALLSLAFAAPSIAALAAAFSLIGRRPYRDCVAANLNAQPPALAPALATGAFP